MNRTAAVTVHLSFEIVSGEELRSFSTSPVRPTTASSDTPIPFNTILEVFKRNYGLESPPLGHLLQSQAIQQWILKLLEKGQIIISTPEKCIEIEDEMELSPLNLASEYDMIPIRPGEEDTVRRLINHQSNGWLNLALLAMEVSQMVTQGMWERDSMLLQLPHFTKDLAKRCQENPGKNSETVFDLVEMEDEERQELLKIEEVNPGKEVTLQVMLERDMEGRTEVGPVDSLRYPKTKEEGWRLVVGDTKTNQLLAIKRVSLQRKAKVKLDFTVPSEPGEKSYTLYFMCDSYLGCDQEYSFSVDVKGSGAGDHMEE
ncbi:unnamed protein product [Arabidopsis arenosa]|uniref:SEC63 domain-containing protein n=1 Tax=Arabidopsis arenosa TaxID=38785 RepID=A0A8S1ZGH1_ARAAE|nr:unnamed protein product [Arabidopsis arenosa]